MFEFRKRRPGDEIKVDRTIDAPPQNSSQAETGKRATRDSGRRSRSQLGTECYRQGYHAARVSGAVEASDSVLSALEANAQGIAQTWLLPQDAKATERKLATLQDYDTERKRRAVERDRSASVHRDSCAWKATLPPVRGFPEVPWVFKYAVTVGLVASIAPTFHDLLVGLDPFFKWLVAVFGASGISLLLVHGLLPMQPVAAIQRKENTDD